MSVITLLINNLTAFIKSFDMQEINVIVLSLTLFVIIRYTIATFGLLKETKFQSDLSISPMIIVIFDMETKKFNIKNIGKGIAINISIDSLDIFVSNLDKKNSLRFDELNLLEPDRTYELLYTEYINNKEVNPGIVHSYIRPDVQNNRDIKFAIEYSNCLGHKYHTIITTGKNGVKIVKIEKATNINLTIRRMRKYVTYKIVEYTIFVQRMLNNRTKDK